MRVFFCFLFLIGIGTFENPSFGCTATLTECGKSCTATAPAGGSTTCYVENGTARCKAWDAAGNLVVNDSVTCGGGGSNGGSGSNGGGSDGCINTLGCWPWLL